MDSPESESETESETETPFSQTQARPTLNYDYPGKSCWSALLEVTWTCRDLPSGVMSWK